MTVKKCSKRCDARAKFLFCLSKVYALSTFSLTSPASFLNSLIGWFSNRTGTSVDDGKARGKDWTRLPVPNLPLCHWSSQLFNLHAPSSTDVSVLLLNQPNNEFKERRFLATDVNRKWTFCNLGPWFWTDGWAYRLYKSKASSHYKFSIVRAD